MMDLIEYMQSARGGMVVDLQRNVQDSLKRLAYLLDVHTFSTEEMELNQTTLLWPQGIAPVFEENEQVSLNNYRTGRKIYGDKNFVFCPRTDYVIACSACVTACACM